MLTIQEQPNYFAYVTNPDHALGQYAQVTKLIHHATEHDINYTQIKIRSL